MSYILEALKRSQQQAHGDLPSLLTAPNPAPGFPRRTLVWVFAALLIIIPGVLVLFPLVQRSIESQRVSAQALPITAIEVPLSTNTPKRDESRQNHPITQPPPQPTASEPAPEISSEPVSEAPAKPASSPPEGQPLFPAQPPSPPAQPPAGAPQQRRVDQRELEQMREELLALKRQIEHSAKPPPTNRPPQVETHGRQPLPAGSATATATPPATVTPSWSALPSEIQQILPERKVSVLAYSALPERRFIVLNGDRMGEGERSREGLQVHQIRSDGVVFEFRDHYFFDSAYR